MGEGRGGGPRRVSCLPKSGAYFLREFCVSTLVGLRNENKLKDEANNTFCLVPLKRLTWFIFLVSLYSSLSYLDSPFHQKEARLVQM